MTRRESFRFLCVVPLASLPVPTLGAAARALPANFSLAWDWDPSSGGPVDYFEVTISRSDAVAGDGPSLVARVAGHERSCKMSVPGHDAQYHASVRAVNAHGSSVPSAPVLV
jgi:hypothetical protein